MGFPRQGYWSGLPFLLQGIFLTQGLNPSHDIISPKAAGHESMKSETHIFKGLVYCISTNKLGTAGAGVSVWLEGQERKEIRRKCVEIRGMKIRRRNSNRHTENGFCNCQCALIKSPASKGLDLRSDRNTTNLHLDIGASKNYSVVTPQGSKDRKSNTNATHTINWSMSSEICIPKKSLLSWHIVWIQPG